MLKSKEKEVIIQKHWFFFQIENEYGSYKVTGGYCDHDYMRHLRNKAFSLLGKDAVIFTTDGDHDSPELRCGTIEGVYATIDFHPTRKWRQLPVAAAFNGLFVCNCFEYTGRFYLFDLN